MLAICGFASAQASSNPSGQTQVPQAEAAETIRSIQLRNEGAIMRAGASGDRVFVPYLRDQLHNKTKDSPTWLAHIALAKLGELDQLEWLKCEVLSDSLQPPVPAISYVGGWFAIQLYEKFLDDYASFSKSPRRRKNMHDEDILYQPPSWYALMELPKIVPDSPLPITQGVFSRKETERNIKIWKDWIAAHKEALSKLQPVGEGINFSPYGCKSHHWYARHAQ